MSGHDVLGFPRTPIFIKKIFYGTDFQPVPAQAKACGYILSIYPLNTGYKIPAGHYWDWGDYMTSYLRKD